MSIFLQLHVSEAKNLVFRLKHFDWSKSEGAFKSIVNASDEKVWAKRCNEILKELYQMTEKNRQEECSPSVSHTRSSEPPHEDMGEKRKASCTLIDQIRSPSKRET